jgi:histone H3/H4
VKPSNTLQNEAGDGDELSDDASDESVSDDNMDIDLGAWDTGDEAEAGALPSIKKSGLVIDKDAMTRLLRDVSAKIAPGQKWQSSAVEAIHEAAEAFLIGQFQNAQMIASQKNKTTVEADDMRLAAKIAGIRRSDSGTGASSGPLPLFGFGSSASAGEFPFGGAQMAPPTSAFPPTSSQLTQDASNLAAINGPPTIMNVQTARTTTARFSQTSTSVTDTSGDGRGIGQEAKETKKYWTRSQEDTKYGFGSSSAPAQPSASVYTTNRFAATSSSSSPSFPAYGTGFSFTPQPQPTQPQPSTFQFTVPPNVDNSSVPRVNLAAAVPPQPQPAMVFTQDGPKPLDECYSPVIPMISTVDPIWSAEVRSIQSFCIQIG